MGRHWKHTWKDAIYHCAYCRREFKPKRLKQRFCRARCRWNAWSKTHPRVAI